MERNPEKITMTRELVLFRISQHEFCVDIGAVREIRGFTPVTPLPRSPPYLRGVINLRGTVLPIVALRDRLAITSEEAGGDDVIIVAQIGHRQVGLLVDAVSDIISVPSELFQGTPDLASDVAKTFVEALINLDDRMIGYLGLEGILPLADAEAA